MIRLIVLYDQSAWQGGGFSSGVPPCNSGRVTEGGPGVCRTVTVLVLLSDKPQDRRTSRVSLCCLHSNAFLHSDVQKPLPWCNVMFTHNAPRLCNIPQHYAIPVHLDNLWIGMFCISSKSCFFFAMLTLSQKASQNPLC